LREHDEAASGDVADEVHARRQAPSSSRAVAVDQRIALAEALAVVQPAHLVGLDEPRGERHVAREQALEVLVDRHLPGQERERVGVARREHARGLQRAHHVGARCPCRGSGPSTTITKPSASGARSIPPAAP
jgi:hypothetical protein